MSHAKFFIALCAVCTVMTAAQLHAAPEATKDAVALTVLDQQCSQLVAAYQPTEMLRTTFKDTLSGVLRGQPPNWKVEANRHNWLPMVAEVLYGQRLHDQETNILDRDSKTGARLYPKADQLLDKILTQVQETHDYHFQLFILSNPGRNALARPGGFLYLDQGLFDKSVPASKAYFALAHEIAHVLQRHETKELQSLIVDSLEAKSELVKALAKVKKEPLLLLTKVKLSKDQYTRHHMNQELQADSCATRLLARVYARPQELLSALGTFIRDLPPERPNTDAPTPAQQEPNDGTVALIAQVFAIVATPARRHPNAKERGDNLAKIYTLLEKTKVITGSRAKN